MLRLGPTRTASAAAALLLAGCAVRAPNRPLACLPDFALFSGWLCVAGRHAVLRSVLCEKLAVRCPRLASLTLRSCILQDRKVQLLLQVRPPTPPRPARVISWQSPFRRSHSDRSSDGISWLLRLRSWSVWQLA
jgi:hypothetical protein